MMYKKAISLFLVLALSSCATHTIEIKNPNYFKLSKTRIENTEPTSGGGFALMLATLTIWGFIDMANGATQESVDVELGYDHLVQAGFSDRDANRLIELGLERFEINYRQGAGEDISSEINLSYNQILEALNEGRAIIYDTDYSRAYLHSPSKAKYKNRDSMASIGIRVPNYSEKTKSIYERDRRRHQNASAMMSMAANTQRSLGNTSAANLHVSNAETLTLMDKAEKGELSMDDVNQKIQNDIARANANKSSTKNTSSQANSGKSTTRSSASPSYAHNAVKKQGQASGTYKDNSYDKVKAVGSEDKNARVISGSGDWESPRSVTRSNANNSGGGDANSCISQKVRLSGGMDLKNNCGREVNLQYCVHNPKSHSPCDGSKTKTFPGKTLGPGKGEFIPFYADAMGQVKWAACFSPELVKNWTPGVGYYCK